MTARRTLMLPPAPDTIDGGHWESQGACLNADAELFFLEGNPSWESPRHDYQRQEAKKICAGCTQILTCRLAAIERKDVDSISGGMTPKERARWSRKQKRRTA